MAGIHNRKVIAGLMLCAMALAGCGSAAQVPEVVENTSLIIAKDGAVTSHIVDVFDKDYYDLDGLKKMALEEAAAYNTAHQTSDTALVTVDRVESLSDSSSVVVTYSFDGVDTYSDYNGSKLFYGTVQEAVDAGYSFDKMNQVLFDTKGEKSIVSSALSEEKMTEKHVIVLEDSTRVYCPYKVAYASESAAVQDDGSIDTTGVCEEEFPVIIVLDK